MTKRIRMFLALEATVFILTCLIHFGVPIAGYRHPMAGIAETVIAIVLVTGLISTWLHPVSTRRIAIGVQGFAFLATLAGLFAVAAGVGPQTLPDMLYQFVMLVALAAGIVESARRATA